MPVKGQAEETVKLSIAVKVSTKRVYDRERKKRNLSQHEALLLLMDKAGWHVPVRGRK